VDGGQALPGQTGETPTGNLDARTINELNTPPAVRIRQIKVTLERWRWLPHSFSQPPVVVNLTEYRVGVVNPDGTRCFLQERYHRKKPTGISLRFLRKRSSMLSSGDTGK
jgi:hypothetical protein